jgi:ribonuclease H / adenosylcobalamin/alpha-ribazole phosphatase
VTEPRQAPGEPAPGEPAPGEQAPPGWGPDRDPPTVLLLLRHGQTELSAERRFTGREDIPLTKDGFRQARAAARRLARSNVNVIVTSPARRARHTAEAVAEATAAPLAVDDDLLEADFGAWHGLTFAEAGRQFPDALAAWLSSPDAAPPDGESFAVVAKRVFAALDRLVDEHRQRTIVVVSHVTPIKTLLCRALLAPPAAMFRMQLDVASLSQIDLFADGQCLVRSVNDTAHLRRRRG